MAGVQFCIAETSRDTTTMRDEEPGQRQKGKSRHSEQHERFGDCTSSTQLWQEDRGSDGMERGRIWQHPQAQGDCPSSAVAHVEQFHPGHHMSTRHVIREQPAPGQAMNSWGATVQHSSRLHMTGEDIFFESGRRGT